MKPIEERLRSTIGLDAASVGPSLIQRAVRQRMRSLGLKRLEDYPQVLEQSHAEWHELVEAVVITETWFFRDPEPIAGFVRLVRDQWLPAHRSAALRLLSVPCSSGEEPFSLVMALLDAGVPADRFQIEGVDISARALTRATRGVYGRNSFRSKDLGFRSRYFRTFPDGFILDPAVRDRVRFYQGNFLSDGFLDGHAHYDFIFCRNLFMYFDPLMRQKALGKLERLLAPGGVLFVGPVDRPLVVEHGFVMADIPTTVAFRKADRAALSRRPAGLFGRSGMPGKSRRQGELMAAPEKGDVRLAPSPVDAPPAAVRELKAARRLAEAGYLKESAEVCEAYLSQRRASAEAYYLLGLIRTASGKPGAMECYRKALYLEPNHYECLLEMSLLLLENGEVARARTFENRAQRIKAIP
jgi:chemotaxis protein methyltransferase WspC